MKLYKLDMIIDGYGGILPLKFFRNFEDAKKELLKNQAIYIWEGKYEIEGTKETSYYEDTDNLSLIGICYSDKEIEEEPMLLRYAFISITLVEFNFDSDVLYEMYVAEGYTSYMWNNIDRISDIPSRNEAIIGYAPTEKKIRKLAKKHKRYARCWNRIDEDKISACGYGEDYLCYRNYIIQ